jgi:hypothetical protein
MKVASIMIRECEFIIKQEFFQLRTVLRNFILFVLLFSINMGKVFSSELVDFSNSDVSIKVQEKEFKLTDTPESGAIRFRAASRRINIANRPGIRSIGVWILPQWNWNNGSSHGLFNVKFKDGSSFNVYKDKQNRLIIAANKKYAKAQLDWRAGSWHHLLLTWEPDEKGYKLACLADGRRIISPAQFTATEDYKSILSSLQFGSKRPLSRIKVSNLTISDKSFLNSSILQTVRNDYRRNKLFQYSIENKTQSTPIKWSALSGLNSDQLAELESKAENNLCSQWLAAQKLKKLSAFAVHNTDKVYPEPFLNKLKFEDALNIFSARNQIAFGQFVIIPKSLSGGVYRIRVSDLKDNSNNIIKSENIKVRRICPVKIPAENNYPSSSHFRSVPDILTPINESETVEENKIASFLLDFPVPKDQIPGIYKGKIDILNGKESAALEISLEILPLRLPVRMALKTSVACDAHNFNKDYSYGLSDPKSLQEMITKYALNQLKHHLSLKYIWHVDMKSGKLNQGAKYILRKDGSYDIDFDAYDKVVESYIPYGLNTIMVNRREWGFKSRSKNFFREFYLDDKTKVKKVFLPQLSDKYLSFARQTFSLWERHLKNRKWPVLPYSWVVDEPNHTHFKMIQALSKISNKYAPSIPFMVTVHKNPVPDAIVGIYTMRYDRLSRNIYGGFIKNKQNFWLYCCTYPGKPYAGLKLMQSGVDHLLAGWLCWRFNAAGFLYWSSNVWSRGSWAAKNYNLKPLKKGYLGGNASWGDGILFYPGTDGPLDSLRVELLRLGIEDYEWLHILEALIQKCHSKGIKVSKQIQKLTDVSDLIKEMRKYEREGKYYTQRRRMILDSIILLEKKLATD